jgi:uncharacterized protein (DUF608 family)
MNIERAKDLVAQKRNFDNWNDFRTKGLEDGFYNTEKYEFLEEAFTIARESDIETIQRLKIEINTLKLSEKAHELSKKMLGEQYRALVSEQIAQLRAVIILSNMMKANHTHAEKTRFMSMANTIIEEQIQKLKDDYGTAIWKFGDIFTGNELPF